MVPGIVAWRKPVQKAIDSFLLKIGSDISLDADASIFSLGSIIEHTYSNSIFTIGDVLYECSNIELQVGSTTEQDILKAYVTADSSLLTSTSYLSLNSDSSIPSIVSYVAIAANSASPSNNNSFQITSSSL